MLDIRSGLSQEQYEAIGIALSGLKPGELLTVEESMRRGHAERRHREGVQAFVGHDRWTGVAMDCLAEATHRANNGNGDVMPQVMA